MNGTAWWVDAMAFGVEVIAGTAEGDWLPLALEWNRLADRSAYPLVRFEWFHAAARFLADEQEVRLVVVRRDGQVAGVAPLCRTVGCGGRHLALIGAQLLGEPGGLLFDGPAAFERLIAAASGLGLPLRLARLREDGVPHGLLRHWTRRRMAVLIRRPAAPSPYVPIAGAWEDYEAGLSARRRYDLRRARRRAEEMGTLVFEVARPFPDELAQALELVIEVEARSWKGRQGSALKHHPRLGAFFRCYAQAACVGGMLRVGIMRIDGQAAAILLGVEAYDRFWVLKIGYDDRFGVCSPGILLMHEVLRHAFGAGLVGFEFLGSDADWLRMWPNRQLHAHVSYGVFPAGWASWLAFVREAAVRGLSMWRTRQSG